ncbi:class I SAM-dependent RNA methyltransferase [Herbiconiux sp. KACC 21604]|nr:class I SAM-dependent RNA methyltransferase [Herbiconiux sp. SALV-R1]QJU54462.1 class I SAM-dependent RNA methyltransferase [Herbiconiux sp. SALV-R1]WPO85540.1 class I SAM-dependent RNA methyltransferase [Herbiconiux sp. KACC 21604]
MSDSQNELVELDIDTVAHGGVSVARLDGRVVFVADTLPGERVLARVVDRKSSFWRADTVEVLSASPDRVEHVWSAASIDRDPEQRAGGAEFGHIALARQRGLKAEVLQDALRRFGRVERDVEVEPVGDGAGDGLRWRTRLRLHVGPDGRPGPYASRSHTVVEVDDLPLATEAIEAEAGLGRSVDGAAALELVETAGGEVRVRRVSEELSKTGGRRGRPSARRPGRGQGRRSGDRQRSGAADASMTAVSTERPATIVERVGEREFRLAENGFWQVHRHAARTLTEAVAGMTLPELFDPRAANHDLYGGVGLFAAALGDRFGQATRITSVESEPLATEYAGENLAEWIGAQAVTASVDRYLAELERSAGPEERRRLGAATVVLDPPRTGAGKAVAGALTRLAPAQIVYVACDPVAFARDTAYLAEGGYRLDALRAFDLFPHTHHLESVGRFVKD